MKPLAKALIVFAVVWRLYFFRGDVIGLGIPGVDLLRRVLRHLGVVHSAERRAKAARSIDGQRRVAIAAATRPRGQTAMTAAWHPPADRPRRPPSRYAQQARRRRMRPNWRDRANQELAAKPLRENSPSCWARC